MASVDLNNIQGDILEGLPKKGETFLFFQIKKDMVKDFCSHLLELTPLITSAADVRNDRQRIADEKKRATDTNTNPKILEMSGINISFSQKGLDALSITDDLGDEGFKQGMVADVEDTVDANGIVVQRGLRDDLDKWKDAFMDDIHGVLLITGSSHPTIEKTLARVLKIFHVGKPGTSIEHVYQVSGHSRPGDQSAHEHFGFADGISQPTIKDFSPPSTEPESEEITFGRVLVGRDGDVDNGNRPMKRPRWALDGSFLCFRQLKQRVPEFDAFLEANSGSGVGQISKELLGARLVGRWKSGAPIDKTDKVDDPELALDPARNNDFRYDVSSQERCPFAAHTRKTYPRSDLDFVGGSTSRRIFRRGIQYGPEVTREEAAAKKSSSNPKLERGLLFACYQSNLENGFRFIQRRWANDPTFPPRKTDASNNIINAGFDPIVGVGNEKTEKEEFKKRFIVGHIPTDAPKSLDLTSDVWVVSRGGEYFFSPSISALQATFAQVA